MRRRIFNRTPIRTRITISLIFWLVLITPSLSEAGKIKSTGTAEALREASMPARRPYPITPSPRYSMPARRSTRPARLRSATAVLRLPYS